MSQDKETLQSTYCSFEEYQKAFFPLQKEKLPPTANTYELGIKLAERALEELGKALLRMHNKATSL